MNQAISDLTDAEAKWIRSQLESARQFVGTHSRADSEDTLTLACLDRAFKNWTGSDVTNAESINAVINAVGIAYGQILSEALGLRWVIATDESGSDLAVHGAVGDVLIYPANFVAKRWERRETDFLEDSFEEIAKTIRSIQESFKPKPWWRF
jgi:hypothetical protein